jgi:hypothetical protein
MDTSRRKPGLKGRQRRFGLDVGLGRVDRLEGKGRRLAVFPRHKAQRVSEHVDDAGRLCSTRLRLVLPCIHELLLSMIFLNHRGRLFSFLLRHGRVSLSKAALWGDYAAPDEAEPTMGTIALLLEGP